jgi:hypothetical protein
MNVIGIPVPLTAEASSLPINTHVHILDMLYYTHRCVSAVSSHRQIDGTGRANNSL